MLRKRTGSIQKEQHQTVQMAISDTNFESYSQSDALGSNSTFNAPLVFVGMGPTGSVDSDSVKSPTSPLDVSFLSNISNFFRTPSSLSNEVQQRSWDCAKVGLSIVDSLEECSKFSGKILQASDSKKANLIPRVISEAPNCKSYMDSAQASKSLLKDFCKIPCTQNSSICPKGESTVLFEIGDAPLQHESSGKTVSCPLDSFSPIKNLPALTGSNFDSESENFALKQICSPPHFIGGSHNNTKFLLPAELNSNTFAAVSSDEFVKSQSACEIELSEDYTCVISHGPNSKTTHIFCDCILKTQVNDLKKINENVEEEKELSIFSIDMLHTPNQYTFDNFLSFCYHCNKKLGEGEDIYIYRGEMAFCSLSCRTIVIMNDEEFEISISSSENSPKCDVGGEPFESDIPTAT